MISDTDPSRGGSSALESEKEKSERSELDEGEKSAPNSPSSRKMRNRSQKMTPNLDSDEDMYKETNSYRGEIARNRYKAVQQNILHFSEHSNYISGYERDKENGIDGHITSPPWQAKGPPPISPLS
ncbi:hypothetical protein JTB14_036935 [Gonioctena quinquepunctata]|nr:hypothetical protein JTB14_036935 [Gonioctena quinquepunctata]